MVLFTTLKANKEHGIDDLDIAIAYDETYGTVGALFDDQYVDDWGYTDFDKLTADYTNRQIASACLKQLKQLSKGKDSDVLNWTPGKVFIDLDAPEIAYMQIEELIKNGTITGSGQLTDIDRKARKKGCTIKKEVCYDQENHYYTMVYIDDLIDEHFPCYADLNDDYCNNCGNCQ